METRPLSDLIAALRKGDGNGCERSNWLMQEAADALMANQGAIVNSIIERTRTEATDDERAIAACIDIASTVYGGYDDAQGALSDIHMMLAPIAAHRTEVPEPSAENVEGILDRATLDEYMRVDPDETYERLVVKANALASTVRRVLAQGEPSDAQLLAALNAYHAPDGYPGQTLEDWSEGSVRAMRAALRAAGSAR